jgi:hypothetical protein
MKHWITKMKHRFHQRDDPPLPRPLPNVTRIPARSYHDQTCDVCGHIFDVATTSDIELVTGLCQTCWGNQYRIEE